MAAVLGLLLLAQQATAAAASQESARPDGPDEFCALQSSKREKKCLRFIHIPKTMGGSIEVWRKTICNGCSFFSDDF